MESKMWFKNKDLPAAQNIFKTTIDLVNKDGSSISTTLRDLCPNYDPFS